MDKNNEDRFQIFDPETGRINFDDVAKLHQEDYERPEKAERLTIRD